MTKQKNPAAVALGRLGGKKTGRKGFAAISPERLAEIQKMARKAKKAKNSK